MFREPEGATPLDPDEMEGLLFRQNKIYHADTNQG